VLASARAAAVACARYGTTLPHAAVQFPLQHAAVACVVAGMRTSDHVRQNVEWATVELPVGLFDALDTRAQR
jgi:D-threo-aldose 1-dehydrogenase